MPIKEPGNFKILKNMVYQFVTEEFVKGECLRYRIEGNTFTEAFKKAVAMGIVKNRRIRNYNGTLSRYPIEVHKKMGFVYTVNPDNDLDDYELIWAQAEIYHSPTVLQIWRDEKGRYYYRTQGRDGKYDSLSEPTTQYNAWWYAREFCKRNKVTFNWDIKEITRK